jgi:Tfp pilus assembly protein PilN
MIEINLLQEELKVKAKKTDVNQKYLLLLAPPAILVILLFLHLLFGIKGILIGQQLNFLNKKWTQLQPQLKQLEVYREEFEPSTADGKALQQFLAERVFWSEKLNKLSLYLPNGIWFTSFSLSDKEFVLNGSVVSLQTETMSLVNTFIGNLKKDTLFYSNFQSLQLSSAQSKQIGSYEVLDFVFKGVIKSFELKQSKAPVKK